jgi:GNAT superfamily N-acetyltransferase
VSFHFILQCRDGAACTPSRVDFRWPWSVAGVNVGRFATMLHVDPEDPKSAVAQTLIAQLSHELAERYPEDEDAGAGQFAPGDAAMARSIFVVAWFGSDAVGCGALRPFAATPGTGEIKRMYVAPSVRGRGIGREILRELERHARGFGYSRLCLETGLRQPEALALYEKEGFMPIAKYPPYENNTHSLCFEKPIPAG